MKKNMMLVLITAISVSVCWYFAIKYRDRIHTVWLLSSVKAPGRMALNAIKEDFDRGDHIAAQNKVIILHRIWQRFQSQSDDEMSGVGIGDVMEEFSKVEALGTSRQDKPGGH